MVDDARLRDELLGLLGGGGAHVGFDDTIAEFPVDLRGRRVEGQPHTAWRLLEHMRIAQWDILEYVRNPNHESPEWPAGYWPPDDAPPDPNAWDHSVEEFKSDLEQLTDLIRNPETSLLEPLPHTRGATVLHEALLVADHNAYHLGELILLRRLLGTWPPQ